MSMQLPKLKRLTWLLIPAVLVSLITGLPSKSRAQEKEPVDVLKVETDLVVFDAQVIDKKTRRVIGDLSKDDFELYEKGVKQPISYFGRDELPLSIMLLLDVSGSVRPILHQIRDGALSALQRLKPQDQVAIMAFANISNLAQDFTKDRSLAARKTLSAEAPSWLPRWKLPLSTCKRRQLKPAGV
jgi:VWFA-related protein